MRHILED